MPLAFVMFSSVTHQNQILFCVYPIIMFFLPQFWVSIFFLGKTNRED